MLPSQCVLSKQLKTATLLLKEFFLFGFSRYIADFNAVRHFLHLSLSLCVSVPFVCT